MLSTDMVHLIRQHTAGMVATVDADGSPAVSPKATFVVVDEKTIAFGNLRSPGTLSNIRRNPRVEVCFIDVLSRKAVRVRGTARLVAPVDAPDALDACFDETWGELKAHMSHYVVIDLDRAELIVSPAYDYGATEAELRASNLARLEAL